jgi:hypothetical protein
MKKLFKSRKGFSTVVTIFSILLLILIFIIFIFLFKTMAGNKTGKIDSRFSSIQTELLLKSFLRAQASGNPEDLTPYAGEVITNADLVSWTCNDNKKSKNYKALKDSINNYYDTFYEDDWNMEIIYSDTRLDKKGFGHTSALEKLFASAGIGAARAAAFQSVPGSPGTASAKMFLQYRGPGYAFQIIPCLNDGFAIISFKTNTIG